MLFWQFLDRRPIYTRGGEIITHSKRQSGRVAVETEEKKESCSVMVYCGLSARQELSGQLVDLIFFGWILIDILTCISFCDRRAKEFKVLCKYICSVLDREVRCSKYFSGSQSLPSF